MVLGEQFLAERPLGIMQGIGTNLHSQENNIAATRALLENATHLTQPEKLLHLMRLDTVGLIAFNCAQLHELVLQQAFDPDRKVIDLRMLRRKMSDLLGCAALKPRRGARDAAGPRQRSDSGRARKSAVGGFANPLTRLLVQGRDPRPRSEPLDPGGHRPALLLRKCLGPFLQIRIDSDGVITPVFTPVFMQSRRSCLFKTVKKCAHC